MISSISTTVQGKIVIDDSMVDGNCCDILVLGFHGYGETAEKQMERLNSVEWPSGVVVVSVQALFPMYNANDSVGATWMTSMNRRQNVIDNAQYVKNVLSAIAEKYTWNKLVVCGFSQGGTLLYRMCSQGLIDADFLAVVGADLPRDISDSDLVNIPALLMGRGKADSLYDRDKFYYDYQRLQGALSVVEMVEWRGGHRWRQPFSDALACRLARL